MPTGWRKIATSRCGKSNFTRCKGCGQLYRQEERDLTGVVDGDDFLTEGTPPDLSWMDTRVMVADELCKSENRRRLITMMTSGVLHWVQTIDPKALDQMRLKAMGRKWVVKAGLKTKQSKSESTPSKTTTTNVDHHGGKIGRAQG